MAFHPFHSLVIDLKTSVIVLWVYIVLLLAGGLMGFLKSGSKISLITSAAFAVPLALCAQAVIPMYPIAPILLGLLVLMFALRYSKRRKFMPTGLMAAVTTLVLIIVCWIYSTAAASLPAVKH
jgi:uncharacterized membrane protein (UPF0136 family)